MGRRRRSPPQVVGFRYHVGLHLALCQGPVDAVQQILVGERSAWGDASRDWLPEGHGLGRIDIHQPQLFGGDAREGGVVGALDLLSGASTQGRNDYLQSQLGAEVPAFRGVLSLVARRVLVSTNNPYIKPWALRVRRFVAGWHGQAWAAWLAEVKGVGMNPAHIIVQCLTDPNWGMGYPLDSIGESFFEAASILRQEGFGLNLVWTRQQAIEQFIGEVLDHIAGILYVHPQFGTFELRLLRANYQISELPLLGPDEIVRIERFERAQYGELPNEITVVYTDWDSGNETTLSVQNLASVQLQGGVINQRRDYPGVSRRGLAAQLALRDLQVLGTPLARLSLIVAASALPHTPLPGDVFQLHWPRLGVERLVLRVTAIDFGELGALEWRIEAIEDVFSLGSGSQLAALPPAPPAPQPPTALVPDLVLAHELPYWEIARFLDRSQLAFLQDTDAYVGALAAAGGAGQQNWTLASGASASELTPGPSAEYAPLLALSAPLPVSEADAVTTLTPRRDAERLTVGSYAYLLNASGAIVECVAVLAFDPVSLSATLARGLLDTTPQAHAAGTRLLGVGTALASEGLERAQGEAVFVAAIPRTFSHQGAPHLANGGLALQLSGRQARPYAPGQVRLNGQIEPASVSGDLRISWAHRDRTLQTAYLVQQHEGHIGPEPGVTYTVRIRNRNGALVRTASGISGTEFIWTAAQATADAGALGDQVSIEISAERAGYSSWQSQVRRVQRIL